MDAAKTMESIRTAIEASGGDFTHDDTLAGYYYLLNASGQPAKFIDIAIANSDPAGQTRYGYQVKPYNGYYFALAKGEEINGKQVPYRTRDKQEELKWEKGSFLIAPLAETPSFITIVATPADVKGATIIKSWRTSYLCRFLSGAPLEYVRDDVSTKGWTDLGPCKAD